MFIGMFFVNKMNNYVLMYLSVFIMVVFFIFFCNEMEINIV